MDELFEELEAENPEHFAVRQYKKYKLAAGKTAKSILISCGARLAPFDIAELRELTSYDEMELDMLGDQRTAMFVIISDTDDTFNFIVAIMYTQLFNLLCDRADDVHGGRLPYHVRLLLDEFANIGQIPKFDKLIATIRSREISASIILQSQSQLKTIYKDAAETISGNCDTMLFLGGKESTTLKEISETLGKETIDLYNTSDTRGQSRSYGLNYQKTGKELMSRDELSVMDGNKCILQLRGVRPFLSDKFDITKHKRYRELSDYDEKNAFDVEAYMKHQLKIRRQEEFTFETTNFHIEGKAGSWLVLDTLIIDGREFFLMEHMEYGRNAAYVILDAEGKIVAEDNRNGFDENAKQQIREYLHPPKPVQKPEEKPPLENWQKYMENGEYLRSSEISEEQNYNMIDGRRNNMPPKKTRTSVLVKLHQKQAEIAKRSGKEVPQMAVAEDMERRRK